MAMDTKTISLVKENKLFFKLLLRKLMYNVLYANMQHYPTLSLMHKLQ